MPQVLILIVEVFAFEAVGQKGSATFVPTTSVLLLDSCLQA